jgi:ribosomal protein L40E
MNGTRNSSDLGQELRLVPWWSYLFGGIAFLCLQFLFQVVIPRHPNPPPEGVRLFLGTLAGLALGAYFMLLGYVNVDAGRRGMSRTVWTLVVIFIPNGIGYIIYFLMRKPLSAACLQCGTQNDPAATFCRKCGNRLKPVCAKCGAALDATDAFCTACGTAVTVKT